MDATDWHDWMTGRRTTAGCEKRRDAKPAYDESRLLADAWAEFQAGMREVKDRQRAEWRSRMTDEERQFEDECPF